MSAFLVGQRRFADDDPALTRALAIAHLLHERPRCLCTVDGVPMYVAKAGHGFVLKRMPYTGSQHAAPCRSHEVARRRGTVRQHPMRWLARRRTVARDPQRDEASEALGGALRSLWHRAELTRWQPGFAGKRSWATVRKHLLAAAAASDEPTVVAQRLYVPECFRPERRDEIRTRRLERWQRICASAPKEEPSLVLIGELKKLSASTRSFEAVIKHVPDQRFALADGNYLWLGERFAGDLTWWAASDEIRLIVIASCRIDAPEQLAIESLYLMPVSLQWLPVRDADHLAHTQRLVTSGRTFVMRPPENPNRVPHGASLVAHAQAADRGRQPATVGTVESS